jgi:hypothetical protein
VIIDLILGLACLPLVLLVTGTFTQNMVMMAVRRSRAERGYQERGTGWRGTFRKLFPPPPGDGDPEKLRRVYKIANRCIWVGCAGMALMFVSVMIGITVMKR